MAVLLLGEVTDGALNVDATAKAVDGRKIIGRRHRALSPAPAASAAAAEAAKIAGVSKVLCAEDPALGHRLAEPTAALIVVAWQVITAISSPRRRPMRKTCCRAWRRCWM